MSADATKPKPKLRLLKRHEDYTIGIVCALPKEARAVRAAFDFTVPSSEMLGPVEGDSNAYSYGTMGNYHVVLAHLSGMGKNSAKAAAENMARSFRNIKLCLLVGICGIVPKIARQEAVLGDVVVSTMVKQYDLGRLYPSGFQSKDTVASSLRKAPIEVANFISYLEASDELHLHTLDHLAALEQKALKDYRLAEYLYPYSVEDHIEDHLYKPNYIHKHRDSTCKFCDAGNFCQAAADDDCEELDCGTSELISRTRVQQIANVCTETTNSPSERQQKLAELLPRIFLGVVASGDTVMKSGAVRDEIAKKHKIVAFEMEGAGVWDSLPTVVVKGACDYGDSHKNKKFQEYAALTAAACAKALLDIVQMGIPRNVEYGSDDAPRQTQQEQQAQQARVADTGRSDGHVFSGTFTGSNFGIGETYNSGGDMYFGGSPQNRGRRG